MRLLDLFCGAGGCSVGYHRAGFTDIVGVDTHATRLKRFPYTAVQADAMSVLRGETDLDLDSFDAIHASPPCQGHSRATTRQHIREKHVDTVNLLPETLDLLDAWHARTGRPWVVENVPGSESFMRDYIVMCGAQSKTHDDKTGLTVRLQRHRLFVASFPLLAEPCSCDRTPVGGVYSGGRTSGYGEGYGYTPPIAVQRRLMGLDYMTGEDLTLAIPPAYTEHIGWQLLHHMEAAA